MGDGNGSSGTAATIAVLGVTMVCLSLVSCSFFGGIKLLRRDSEDEQPSRETTTKPTKKPKYYVRPPPVVWSRNYGGSGGSQFGGECPLNSYINYIQFWYGNKNLDGIYAMCRDPKTGDVEDLSMGNPNGKFIGRISAPKGFWDKAKGFVTDFGKSIPSLATYGASDDLPIPGGVGAQQSSLSLADKISEQDGGKKYPYKDLYSSAGITKVMILADNEVRGLQAFGPDGTSSGFGGNANVPKHVFECKNGQVLTGIRARAGNRIDRIQFKCGTASRDGL